MTTDREKAGLRGLVRRTETKAKGLSPNNVEPFREYEWLEDVSVYDKEGKLLERYSPENQVLEQEPIKQLYIYDDEGRLIEKQGYSEDGSAEDLWKYVYDDAGKLTESIYTNLHGITRNQYFYDERGNTVRVNIYNGKDGSLRFVQRYSYKYEEDKKVEERYHNGKQITFFNDAGKKTKVVRYVSADLLDGIEIYNENEQVIESKGFSSDGSLMSHYVHTYDEKGNLIASHIEAHSDVVNCLYEYDEWNSLVKSTTEHKNGLPNREENYIYEYDSQNNWTKKIQVDSDKTGTTSTVEYERTITYF